MTSPPPSKRKSLQLPRILQTHRKLPARRDHEDRWGPFVMSFVCRTFVISLHELERFKAPGPGPVPPRSRPLDALLGD